MDCAVVISFKQARAKRASDEGKTGIWFCEEYRVQREYMEVVKSKS